MLMQRVFLKYNIYAVSQGTEGKLCFLIWPGISFSSRLDE